MSRESRVESREAEGETELKVENGKLKMIGRNQLSRMRITLILIALLFGLGSCSVQKQIAKSAKAAVLDNKALQAAHVGISIYDPTSKQYLYNYQGDKYFVPASNTKIPTCYAAMKYLGDSLVGLKWATPTEKMYENKLLVFQANGDPTFLHKDYSKQPVFNFLQLAAKEAKTFAFMDTIWESKRWGSGWGTLRIAGGLQ